MDVRSLLGLGQWFVILCRPNFSAFHKVYRFVDREPTDDPVHVPTSVVEELLTCTLMAPLFGAALDNN